MQFFLLFLPTLALRAQSELQTKPCILVSLPSYSKNGEDFSIGHETSSVRLVAVNSKLHHAALLQFVSAALPAIPGQGLVSARHNVSKRICSRVVGVVGDFDSSTARVIHALASKANLSIMVMAATSWPRPHQDFPNVLDLSSLEYRIEALVSFTDKMNWTRLGLVSDRTYHLAAELFQNRLLGDTLSPLLD